MVTYYMQTYMGVFMCLDSVIMSALSLFLWKMVTALPSKGIPSHYALDPTNFQSLFQYYMDLPWLLLHVYYTVLPYLLLGLYHWYQKSPFQEICQFTSISHSSCPSRSMLLTGNEYDVWNGVIIRIELEQDCVSCRIATLRSIERNKHNHTASSFFRWNRLHWYPTLTFSFRFYFYGPFSFNLILLNAYPHYSSVYGLHDKTTTGVIHTLEQYTADNRTVSSFKYFYITRIWSDAGSQITSSQLQSFCRTQKITLSLSAPKKQSQNHPAEWSWQSINMMAWSLLIHAHLLDQYRFRVILYATSICSILPIKDLFTSTGEPTAPNYLFTGKKPYIAHYRVFSCPVIAKKWRVSTYGQTLSKLKIVFMAYLLAFLQIKRVIQSTYLTHGILLCLVMSLSMNLSIQPLLLLGIDSRIVYFYIFLIHSSQIPTPFWKKLAP